MLSGSSKLSYQNKFYKVLRRAQTSTKAPFLFCQDPCIIPARINKNMGKKNICLTIFKKKESGKKNSFVWLHTKS